MVISKAITLIIWVAKSPKIHLSISFLLVASCTETSFLRESISCPILSKRLSIGIEFSINLFLKVKKSSLKAKKSSLETRLERSDFLLIAIESTIASAILSSRPAA